MSKSLAHLRAVAEKATPGLHSPPYPPVTTFDSEFVATFDPPTVLKLLAVVKEVVEMHAYIEASIHAGVSDTTIGEIVTDPGWLRQVAALAALETP